MDRDYFQDALQTFNGGDWYGWKKNFKGLNRMSYENIEIVKEGATMPSEADVNKKIAELKKQETDSQNNKASAKQKLQDLGLTVDEIKEAFGI
jgi:basic membrane lipoprotein Med (substrate-binding protein (PBP1-ABC) superfamily)